MVALQPGNDQGTLSPASTAVSMRVLLVEGLADTRETLAELLETLGYQITAVASADEAKRISVAPDAIVSELALADGTGFSVIEELKNRPGWETVFPIALTAYDDPEHRRRAELAGFQEFLVKPVSIWVLHRTLQSRAGA